MRHSGLQRKLSDHEFERRTRGHLVAHLLMLLPMMVFAGLVYAEWGSVPSTAITLTAAVYLPVMLIHYAIARRDALAGMRREGIVDTAYEPPAT